MSGLYRFKVIFAFILALLLFWNCRQQLVKEKTVAEDEAQTSLPDDLWLSKDLNIKLDSLFFFYEEANQKLSERDTLGAEIYFDHAFEVLAHISEEDRQTLQAWNNYDTLLKAINEDYERIYLNARETLEAEEIRADISELEEFYFPDSVLFGKETIVDTSGALPITLNDKVRLALNYFQTKGRFVFTKWLERSGYYEEMVKTVMDKYDVPEELFYVAMIESGFNPVARSYARAVGLWQFISATGRYYGLRHNWWFDERRDVLKSTDAAVRHLKDLHERFGDWYLALAGYNCNPNRVARNMRRYNTRDFWKLYRLPRQTRNYIPTFLAATIIAKNPKKFGFYVEKQEPLRVDTVKISESVDLNVIAKLVDTDYNTIKKLNPAVLRWVTPPDIEDFTLYLPEGSKEKFKAGYAKIPDDQKRSWVRHRIRGGEALSTIAAKYHTSVSVIKSINKLRGNLIRAGHYLLIPVPQNKRHHYVQQQRRYDSYKQSRSKSKVVKNVPGHRKVVYRVKPGDTLGEIAEIYNTRASRIRAWNGLRYGRHIYPNQLLTIWIPENITDTKNLAKAEKETENYSGEYYTVRRGDTLWDISRKYGLSIRDIKELNKMRSSRIRPGDRLKVTKN